MAAIIEVQNLSHTYSIGTPFEHIAVDHISFTVEKGEFLGVIGHTGSGKSTLIQHLNGLLKPTEGDILLGGESIWKDKETTRAARFRVGLVFQYPEYQLFEETVYKDIAFGPKNMGLEEAEIRNRVLRAVGFVGLDEAILDKSPFDLSGGQKRRVAIAGVIAMEPEIVIFDEPTIGLDPKQIIEIRNLIRTLGKEHTVILSTHILQEVQAVCDRIIIINKGKIVADELTENISRAVENTRRFNVKIAGPQRDVLAVLRNMPGVTYAEVLAARDGDAYTYMVESEVGIDIRKKLFWTMAEKKWPIIGLEALGLSIEDIFIAVVDKTGAKKPESKSAARDRRAAAERELAGDIIHKTAEQIQQANDVPEDAPADEGKYYEDYTIKSDTFSGSSDGDKPDGKKED